MLLKNDFGFLVLANGREDAEIKAASGQPSSRCAGQGDAAARCGG